MAMEKVGLQAVITGMNQFEGSARKIDQTYDRLGDSSGKAAGRLSGLGSVARTALGVAVGTVGVQAVGKLAGGLVSLVTAAAPLRDMETAFQNLSKTYEFSSEDMLMAMRKAAKGTVADSDLIASANRALIGSGKELGKEFGQNLPKLLEIARASAKATGESVDFLFNSLVLGIKRGSPMIIDNTGLQLKLGEAQQAYAESLGITVEEMSSEQKQLALLNATMEAGVIMTEAMASETLTTAEKMAALKAMTKNFRDELGIALLPLLDKFLDVLIKVAQVGIPRMISGMQKVVDWTVWLTEVLTTLPQEFRRGFNWAKMDMGASTFIATLAGVGEILDGFVSEERMGQIWNLIGAMEDLEERAMPSVRAWADYLRDEATKALDDFGVTAAIVMDAFSGFASTVTTMIDEAWIPLTDKIRAVNQAIQDLWKEWQDKIPNLEHILLVVAGAIGLAILISILGPLSLILTTIKLLRRAWDEDWVEIRQTVENKVAEMKPWLTELETKLGEVQASIVLLKDEAVAKWAEIQESLGTLKERWTTDWAEMDQGLIGTTLSLSTLGTTWDEVIGTLTKAWQDFWSAFQPTIAPLQDMFNWWVSDELLPELDGLIKTLSDTLATLVLAIDEVWIAFDELLTQNPEIVQAIGLLAGVTVLVALRVILEGVTFAVRTLRLMIGGLKIAIDIARDAVLGIILAIDGAIVVLRKARDWVNRLWDSLQRTFRISVSVSWPSPPSWFNWLRGRSVPPSVRDVAALNVQLARTANLLQNIGTAPTWSVPVPALGSVGAPGGRQVTNIWSPQISANYGQVQSMGSIMQDLDTMAVLYRMG